jgi:DNA-directed RNA polymerase I and III subunit RPAC1
MMSADEIDNVESAGQYKPEELIPEAISILLDKITEVEVGLDKLFEVDTTQA